MAQMRTLLLTVAVCLTARAADLRIGIVGTDTSHVTAFTAVMNDPKAKGYVPGVKVVAAFKGGSAEVESSRTRVEGFAKELQDKYQVKIVDSIPELCSLVDAVLLESVDARQHLAQAKLIIAAGKPLFIDKPLASTLEDARAIARAADDAGVPWFSSSSLRYGGVEDLKGKEPLEGAEAWGPGPLEEHHYLELGWYAIHPLEMLYVLMGRGCQEVTRITTANTDVVVGKWKDGRIGVLRALRPYSHYGAIAYKKTAKEQTFEVAEDPNAGYIPLVEEIVRFFQSGTPPVPNAETLEMFAFLDAAQRSKEAGGKPVSLR
jgi:predicted dehydrogenase